MRFSVTLLALALTPMAEAGDLEDRGAYLARIMDCASCHRPMGPDGAPMVEAGLSGGSLGFEVPGFGIVWPPNLTSDATGLGGWTDAEIVQALTAGVRPDGRLLAPVMPWMAYGDLTEDDLAALVAYLRSLPAVAHATPAPAATGAEAQAPYFTVAMPQ